MVRPTREAEGALAPADPPFWRRRLDAHHFKLAITVIAALGATYFVMSAKVAALGQGLYGFADFQPLWVSGVLAHDGRALVNYDEDALHAAQVALGANPHLYSPFPYPPIFLLALAPLGGLSLATAFAVFMIASGAVYLAAMVWGRFGDWRWWVGALAAPASGITIISGQSGFLTGALAIGGFRLAERHPWLAGVLFGALTFKPQLGVLIPVVLVAAGAWRVIVSSVVTVLALSALSVAAFGWAVWPEWLNQMRHYAGEYDVALHLMPTVYAGAMQAGAPHALAVAIQSAALVVVAAIVWRRARAGLTPAVAALVLVGTFLATPHALNYDMPMMTAAIVGVVVARCDERSSVRLDEAIVLAAAFVTPFAILALHGRGAALFWLPLAALFALLARPAQTVR